tara:strand:+ start:326 stop:676 length:351 start_codon:yes stop_codon:yes gene_type:complete
MRTELTLKDAQKYKDLLSKQFLEIGRSEMINKEETWTLFLKQEKSKEIDPNNLPIIKSILFGESTLSIKEYRDALEAAISKNKYCQVIPILHSMANGNLITELILQSNKINAQILT